MVLQYGVPGTYSEHRFFFLTSVRYFIAVGGFAHSTTYDIRPTLFNDLLSLIPPHKNKRTLRSVTMWTEVGGGVLIRCLPCPFDH